MVVLILTETQAQDLNKKGPSIIDITSFGAKCDGKADDTSALRTAALSVPLDGAILRFPQGSCVIRGTIYLKSRTAVVGRGTILLAALPWSADHESGYALMENMHYRENHNVDRDISVAGMTFDYGTMGSVPVPMGGKHALSFDFTHHVSVVGNVFYLRGGEDAIAGLGVNDLLAQDNAAFDFRNCAYDFWFGSTNVRLIGNYARTEKSSQMVNFNPERSRTDSAGMAATDFVMKSNTLIATGPRAVPIQLEPLGPHTAVRKISAVDNRLTNVYFVLRGDVQNATLEGNVIDQVAGGASAFESYRWHGGTPSHIAFSNNIIVDPQTQGSEAGVIRMEALESAVSKNVIFGSAYKSAAIFPETFTRPEHLNQIQN